jgi:hypothetical protein
MLCRLCHNDADLRKSHIIPEFFYTATYDTLHRFHVITSDPHVPERYLQKGLRERLLCQECEQLFAGWEHYAKERLIDGKGIISKAVPHGVILAGVDYIKFKLFLFSILWRMGVSTLDEFKEVKLGEYHEEKLRQALLKSDPMKEDQYGCFLTALTLQGKIYHDWIVPPTMVKLLGQHCYRVLINGILYCFFVSKQPMPKNFKPLVINRQNQLFILMDDVVNVPFLFDAALDLSKAIRQRSTMPKR